MAVTSQQIADAAGVSRATVDRALKNRGRVKPEVAERIKKIAKEMGYQPNQAARALALAKNPIKIGVILQSAETPFMQEVLKGIRDAQEEIERSGGKVVLRCFHGRDGEQMIACMEELREKGIHGIALVPARDERIKAKIDEFAEEYQIPIVTFNSDVSGSRRISFVGQDNERAGKVAAGLLAESLETAGKVAVITGSVSNPALNSRTRGFREELERIRPDLQILDTYYTSDDDRESRQRTEEILDESPDIKGIYISTPAVTGICDTLAGRKMGSTIKVIANDILAPNIVNLEKGVLNFLIGQDAYIQGHEPLMILFRLLVGETKPEKEYGFTEIIIKTKYNI